MGVEGGAIAQGAGRGVHVGIQKKLRPSQV